MRFPALFAPLLRERDVSLGMLGVCMGLAVANTFGISLWKCTFRETTGLPCPGCGMTRGMAALLRGRVHEAIGWHPFTPVFAIAALVMLVAGLLPEDKRLALADKIAKIEQRTGFALLTLIAMLLFGLWRMWHGPWV